MHFKRNSQNKLHTMKFLEEETEDETRKKKKKTTKILSGLSEAFQKFAAWNIQGFLCQTAFEILFFFFPSFFFSSCSKTRLATVSPHKMKCHFSYHTLRHIPPKSFSSSTFFWCSQRLQYDPFWPVTTLH